LVLSQCAPRTCEGGSKLHAVQGVVRQLQCFTGSLEFCSILEFCVILIGVRRLDGALDYGDLVVCADLVVSAQYAPLHNPRRCTIRAAAQHAPLHNALRPFTHPNLLLPE